MKGEFMEFNVFLETVKCCMEERLGEDYQISGNQVRKNNGVLKRGLMIRTKTGREK